MNTNIEKTKSQELINQINGLLTSIENKLETVKVNKLKEEGKSSQFDGELVESLKSLAIRVGELNDSISL